MLPAHNSIEMHCGMSELVYLFVCFLYLFLHLNAFVRIVHTRTHFTFDIMHACIGWKCFTSSNSLEFMCKSWCWWIKCMHVWMCAMRKQAHAEMRMQCAHKFIQNHCFPHSLQSQLQFNVFSVSVVFLWVILCVCFFSQDDFVFLLFSSLHFIHDVLLLFFVLYMKLFTYIYKSVTIYSTALCTDTHIHIINFDFNFLK